MKVGADRHRGAGDLRVVNIGKCEIRSNGNSAAAFGEAPQRSRRDHRCIGGGCHRQVSIGSAGIEVAAAGRREEPPDRAAAAQGRRIITTAELNASQSCLVGRNVGGSAEGQSAGCGIPLTVDASDIGWQQQLITGSETFGNLDTSKAEVAGSADNHTVTNGLIRPLCCGYTTEDARESHAIDKQARLVNVSTEGCRASIACGVSRRTIATCCGVPGSETEGSDNTADRATRYILKLCIRIQK